MMLCSEVAMTDAEKENEARCKAMLNELISVVKKQTMEMEDLTERMDELAVDLKAIVKLLGAPVQALPPLVPAPTATLVAAVVHAVAAATPRAEAAHAPESLTKCSTSGPDPNAGYAKVAAVSLLSRGATTARRALAEPVNVSSSKSFNTEELDTVTPTRCSTACRDSNTDVPPTCPQKVAPTPPSVDAMLDAAVIALVHSTSEIAVNKDGNTDTLEHAAMGQVEAALASDGHDNLWINYNIRFPDFSSCVFAALVVPAMEVFGEMGDKNKREQYFVDMVWEQWLEPWPPPHRHGNLLELFHKQAGIRSWRTTFANAEMGVLNLLVHGVILVEQLLLPYWDYGKFQSLFWVQLKSYSNTHCHGCVELMVGLVSAEQGVEAMGPFQLVISSSIGFDVVSLSEFFIVYAEVKGYFQGLQVHSSNPNYEMEPKEQKPTHRRNESVDLTSSKVPAQTIEAKMVSERPADDENEVVENGIINGSLKSFSMSDKEQGVGNAGGNARLIGRSETGERGISSRCRPSTSSDENSCSNLKFLNLSSNRLSGSLGNDLYPHLIVVFDVSGDELSGSIPAFANKGYSSQLMLDDMQSDYSLLVMFEAVAELSLVYCDSGERSVVCHNFAKYNFGGHITSLPFSADRFGNKTLYAFLVDHSNFTGSLDAILLEQCGNLNGLIVSFRDNKISGGLTAEISTKCRAIRVLDLASNQISGVMPANICLLVALVNMDISRNFLEGQIPTSFKDFKSLKFLSLAGNNLSGHIPSCFGQLRSLEVLDLSSNSPSGNIPSSLVTLKDLTGLLLNNNKLFGNISNLNQLQTSLLLVEVFVSGLPRYTSYLKIEHRFQEWGLEKGWGDTAERCKETLNCLSEVLQASDPINREKFFSMVASIFNIVVFPIIGYLGQEEVPDAKSTKCNAELEPVGTTKQSNILHMPLKTEDGKDLCQWVSRFDIDPDLERHAQDAAAKILDVLEGKPDLTIGNYTDDNLVASLRSGKLGVTRGTIAHLDLCCLRVLVQQKHGGDCFEVRLGMKVLQVLWKPGGIEFFRGAFITAA